MENQRRTSTKRKKSRLWFWLSALSLAAVGVMLFNTTPDELGPIGITVFFLLLAATLFNGLMWLRSKIFREPGSTSLLSVILIAVLGTGALALNTIEIQAGEIFLLVVFGALLSLYWLKIR